MTDYAYSYRRYQIKFQDIQLAANGICPMQSDRGQMSFRKNEIAKFVMLIKFKKKKKKNYSSYLILLV